MKCYGVTDKGLVRSTNQDSYIISANTNDDILAIVCDGIGGGKGGDVASTMATDYLGDIFSKTHGFADLKQAKDFVRYHITRINFQIYTYAQTHTAFKGMGTTLTALFSGSVGKFVINIGDSRVYGYTAESGLKSLTVDHTWVMDMYRAGTLSLEEAKNHPKKNVITNALGVWSSARMDIFDIHENYQYYLLCSDGLYGYVDASAIEQVLQQNSCDMPLKLRTLLGLALKSGGYDNITIILMEETKGVAHECE